jgi:DNA-binding XRE family transcriptional regulator
MDKRYGHLSLSEQLMLRKQAIDEVLGHPEWSTQEALRHLKKTMRLTSAELARLSGVHYRTVQDIEQGRSEGSVQTMNRLFGVLGLKLGVVRIAPPDA